MAFFISEIRAESIFTMKPWSSTLLSAFAHAALLCIPLSMPLTNVSIQPAALECVILPHENTSEHQTLWAPAGESVPAPTMPQQASAPPVSDPPPAPPKTKKTPVVVENKTPPPPRPQKRQQAQKVKPVDKVEAIPVKTARRQEPPPKPSPAATPVQDAPPPAASAKQEAGPGPPASQRSSVDREDKGNAAPAGARMPADTGPVDAAFGSTNGPRFAHRMLPKYPRLARELGKEGKVVLKLTIDERGHLANVEVVDRAGSGFDEEAVKAVKGSTFIPATRNGKPVTCIARLPIRFELRSSEND